MSDANQLTGQSSLQTPGAKPSRRLRHGLLLGLGIVAGLGIGGYALAMNDGFPGGFYGPWSSGQRLEHMQAFSKRILDGIGATTEQESKIHDIIASTFTTLNKDRKAPEEMRKRVTDLIKAPTIDRAAIEALRVEMVTKFEANSKIFANAIVDAASQLGTDQRAQLADRLTAMAERHRGPGAWRKSWNERLPDEGRQGAGSFVPDGPPGGHPRAN